MIDWPLTSDQDDNSTSHSNAAFAHFIISSTVGALHSHAGNTQASQCYDDTHNHEGASCLEGTWVGEQDRVNPSVIVPNVIYQRSEYTNKVWHQSTGFTGRKTKGLKYLKRVVHFY